MGYIILPIIVMAFFLSLIGVQKSTDASIQPTTQAGAIGRDAFYFLTYRDAIAAYMANNPTFTGTVAATDLGKTFPPGFLSLVGNKVVAATGGTGAGRIVTCYGALSAGSIADALDQTEGDGSLGVSSGTTWSSYSSSAIPANTPLETAVPNGSIVSVIQIGV